jgi:hypothetical protein
MRKIFLLLFVALILQVNAQKINKSDGGTLTIRTMGTTSIFVLNKVAE